MKRVDIDPKSKLLIVKFKFLKRDWEEAVQTRKNMLSLSRKTYMPALKKYLVPPTPENIEALWEWGFSFPDNWKELVGAEDQIQEEVEVLPYLHIQVPDYLDFLRPYQVTAVQFLKWRKGRGLISDDMGCISGDAIIQINRGGGSRKHTLRDLYKKFNRTSGRYTWDKSIKTFTRCYKDDIGVFGLHELEKVLYKGDQECIRIETESGKSIELTEDHELMTPDNNWQAAIDFSVGDYLLTNGDPCCKKCGSTENVITYKYSKFPGYCKKCMYAELRTHKNDIEGIRKRQGSDGYIYLVGKGVRNHHRRSTSGVLEHIYIMENYLGREIDLSIEEVHHKNGIRNDNSLGNLEVLTKREHSKKHKIYNHFDCDKVPVIPRKDKITKIVKVGKKDVYDIVMKDPYRNFIANKFIVHNCGKTIEALAWIRWNRNLGPAIIVVPTSTKLQWEREYKKFYGKNVEILYGKTPYPLRKNTSYIINWEILTYWEKTLIKMPFFCMIADEAHYMGNIKSKRTISAMKIAKKCPSYVPMSGTPIETKTRQLFPLLKLLDRHLFYSEWEFLNRYCLGKSKDGFPNYDGASHTKELHSKVKKLMIRRKKRDVLKDLPSLQRTIVPMDLSKQQRKYKQMEDHFFNTYSPQQRGSIKMDQEFDSLRLQVFDMKYQAIIEWIDEFLLSGEKLVVGAWHQRVIETLHQHYKDCSTMIYGKITGAKREKALQDFYTDKQIIFLQEKSGGVGLDGLQHVCCNMAIIEFPASPTLLDQFESRLERSGQENPMTMAYLIGAGTIEEDIMEALDIRRLNIDAVMDGKESEDVDLLTILFERRMNNG